MDLATQTHLTMLRDLLTYRQTELRAEVHAAQQARQEATVVDTTDVSDQKDGALQQPARSGFDVVQLENQRPASQDPKDVCGVQIPADHQLGPTAAQKTPDGKPGDSDVQRATGARESRRQGDAVGGGAVMPCDGVGKIHFTSDGAAGVQRDVRTAIRECSRLHDDVN